MFLKIETDLFSHNALDYGDIVIVERSFLKLDGLAIIQIGEELKIKEILHDKDFKTIIKDSPLLRENLDFKYFGIITYSISSEEEDFIEMLGEDLFKVS